MNALDKLVEAEAFIRHPGNQTGIPAEQRQVRYYRNLSRRGQVLPGFRGHPYPRGAEALHPVFDCGCIGHCGAVRCRYFDDEPTAEVDSR